MNGRTTRLLKNYAAMMGRHGVRGQNWPTLRRWWHATPRPDRAPMREGLTTNLDSDYAGPVSRAARKQPRNRNRTHQTTRGLSARFRTTEVREA